MESGVKIHIVGAGGLGGYIGGLLVRAGEDVTFLVRGETLNALQTNGLILKSDAFGDLTLPVRAVESLEKGETPDLILFAVKAYDLDSGIETIRPYVGKETAILAVQNGIEHPERLADAFGADAVVPGVVYLSCTIVQPGVIRQMSDVGFIQIGALSHDRAERTNAIAALLRNAGLTVETHDDIWPVLWRKFMDICAFSGVTALTRLTLAQFINVSETRALYRDVMVEILPVARAAGCDLPDTAPDEHLEMLEELPVLPQRGSMAFDLLKGKRIEIDTLNGAVVRIGRQHGIDTPINRAITAALLPYRNGSPESVS
jgi:2-dehydropantoate 2-reductase